MLMPLATIVYWGPDESHLPIRWGLTALVGIAKHAVRMDVFLVVAFGLGGTAWLWLHRAGRTSWPYAVFLGFTASFLCMYLPAVARVFEEHLEPIGYAILAIFGAFFGLVGAVAWLIAWRIAYRKSKTASTTVKHTE
jgi:hypothetical protein